MRKDLYNFFRDINSKGCFVGGQINPRCKFLCKLGNELSYEVKASYKDRSPNSSLYFDDHEQLKNKLQYMSFNEGWFDFKYDEINESLTCIRKTDNKEFFTITKI